MAGIQGRGLKRVLTAIVAVAVLGGVGPFFGSYEFVREQRERAALE